MVLHTMLNGADHENLVQVMPDTYIDVPLYWHQWSRESVVLAALGEEVASSAKRILLQ
ncbi:MAG: hypothetical protein GX070_01810 [Alcaligenaceae bacterium]|nr:hypothetical protein [Alcaligenaceae bacterium]